MTGRDGSEGQIDRGAAKESRDFVFPQDRAAFLKIAESVIDDSVPAGHVWVIRTSLGKIANLLYGNVEEND